jgi:hypothetical protein
MRHLPSPLIPPLHPLPPPSSLLGGANPGLPQPDLQAVSRGRGFWWRRQPEDGRRRQPEGRLSMVEAASLHLIDARRPEDKALCRGGGLLPSDPLSPARGQGSRRRRRPEDRSPSGVGGRCSAGMPELARCARWAEV